MRRSDVKPPSCGAIVLSASSSGGGNSAAESSSDTSVQERKRANIAPVFLRSALRGRAKRSRDAGGTHQPAAPARSPGRAGLSVQRGQLSPPGLHSRLREIQAAEPAFPVRRRLQQHAEDVSQQYVREKRKRMDEISPRVPKRPSLADGTGHCHLSAMDVHNSPVPAVGKQPRSSRLSRSRRLKVQSEISAGLVLDCEPVSGQTDHTEPDEQTPKTSDGSRQVFCIEDRLWTEKYSPRHSSDIIGNSAPLTKLHSWLKRWKLRGDRDSMRKPEKKKEDDRTDSWDCGDFQGEAGSEDDREEPLWNTMLITGPPGVGKTASVYACAQEFGFKVFEVNCASQRSGRLVLSQLKEATQSHLVETSGKGPLKPAYISNYNTSSALKSEPLPGRTALPKTVSSISRKKATRGSRRSARKIKTKPATLNLAHYFKMKAKANRCHFGGLPPPEETDHRTLDESSVSSDQTPPQNKKTATSLILFEEVDVIFDDDVGFLAAIRAFMTTTKRPVVLTTNDPSFGKRFDCSLQEIIYRPPSAASACSYLQLVCLAEKFRVDVEDISCLLRLSSGDIRRCLLQLQLWLQSGGRAQNVKASERGGGSDLQLHSGCSAFMLGLQSATLQFLLKHIKRPSWPETELDELLRLLAESWRRGVPLLYTNLELLLNTVTFSGLQDEASLPHDEANVEQRNQQHVKNISKLSRRKNILGVSDISPLPNLTHKPPRASLSLHETCSRLNTEQRAAQTVSDHLDALADFLDLTSCLDASLPAVRRPGAGSCMSETFVWTGSELKDGLLDEPSEEEEDGNWGRERPLLDIQAAAEGLGCRRCWRRMCEAWTEAQSYRQQLDDQRWRRLMERLAVKSSSENNNLSFSIEPLCAPSVSQRRYELSRTILGSKYFSLQGNREAVSVDYMPLLRFICRSHSAQKSGEERTRHRNYLSRKDLGISKSAMQLLAEDF